MTNGKSHHWGNMLSCKKHFQLQYTEVFVWVHVENIALNPGDTYLTFCTILQLYIPWFEFISGIGPYSVWHCTFFVGMHAQRKNVLIITCQATKKCFDFLNFVTLNSLCYVRLCHNNSFQRIQPTILVSLHFNDIHLFPLLSPFSAVCTFDLVLFHSLLQDCVSGIKQQIWDNTYMSVHACLSRKLSL
jgi:hypothetical protein